jgi:hypothetical protein
VLINALLKGEFYLRNHGFQKNAPFLLLRRRPPSAATEQPAAALAAGNRGIKSCCRRRRGSRQTPPSGAKSLLSKSIVKPSKLRFYYSKITYKV